MHQRTRSLFIPIAFIMLVNVPGFPMKAFMQLVGKHYRWLMLIILSLGMLWIFASRSDTNTTTGELIAQPYEGFLAPDFELSNSSGENLRLSDLRGQAVILNFWASWCPPCRSEMPAIQAVHQAYQDRGLVVLGVNAANQDNLTQAQEFIASMNLTFQLLSDSAGTVQELYAVSALPSTYFIDRAGIIRAVVIGGPMSETLLDIHAREILVENP
jgi:cytochrome c biogenesis protein CcmG/thiol:disulfide interchange protein DsbE